MISCWIFGEIFMDSLKIGVTLKKSKLHSSEDPGKLNQQGGDFSSNYDNLKLFRGFKNEMNLKPNLQITLYFAKD